MPIDRVYVCSAVFIACLKGNEPRSEESKNLLEAARERLVEVHTSFITMTEVIAKERSQLRRKREDQVTITEFMDADYIKYSAVEQLVCETSRFVSWDYQIRAADAIHVATAIRRGCSTFYTLDEKLMSKSGLSTGRVPLPKICFPELIAQQTKLPFDGHNDTPA